MADISDFDKTRIIELEGAYNARDLGGFRTASGGTVKRGMVFRSDELSELTDKDMKRFDALGIKTVVDFRSSAEIRRSRSRCPETVRNLALSIDCGDSSAVIDNINEKIGSKLMENVNRRLVQETFEIYSEFFSLLACGENIPLLFHCTAGKDRTGFAAAMFLSSLGVSLDDIFRDYLLSSVGTLKKFSALIETAPRLTSLVVVRRNYLEAAFDEIRAGFGSVEKYLINRLGVNLNRIRGRFVE